MPLVVACGNEAPRAWPRINSNGLAIRVHRTACRNANVWDEIDCGKDLLHDDENFDGVPDPAQNVVQFATQVARMRQLAVPNTIPPQHD